MRIAQRNDPVTIKKAGKAALWVCRMLLLSSSCSCSFSVLHLSKVPRKATRPSRIPFVKTLPGRRTQGFFILEVRSDSTPDQKYTVTFGQDGNRTKFLTGKIEQNDVKFFKYKSRHEICFQSLVVDTTIIIDQPTLLNKSCDGDDNRPCKKWASEIHPVPVCPEATKVTWYPRQVKFMDKMNSSPQYMTLLTICSKPLLTSPKVPPNYFVKL